MTIQDTKARNRLLGVLFVGVLMAALDIAVVGPALPTLRTVFGVDARALAWVFAIYVLFNLIGTPLMAKLSDRFGRRTIYTLDVALFAAGSLLVAFAPTFGVLLVGRAVQGFGAGGIFPVASAVIGDTFPSEQRGRALGLIGAVWGIAFLLGPILGGLLLLLGWQWLFLINVPFALLVIFLGLRELPTRRTPTPAPFDWAGAMVLSVLLGALAFALNQIDSANLLSSLASRVVWPFLLTAVLLLPVLIWVEGRAADPILNLRLFHSRQISLVTGLSAGAGLSEAIVVFIPALLVATFGVSSSTASFMLVPMVLAMGIGSPISGRMLDRYGSKLLVLSGTGLITLGLLIESLLGGSLVLFYLFSLLFGLGLAVLLGAALRYIMLNEAPQHERASAQGLLTLFTGIGQLVGSVLLGALAASGSGGDAGYRRAFLFLALVMGLLTLSSLGLKSRAREQATLQPQTPATVSP
jgi:EmrB/QacA subfamily drug resistance transporter